MQCLAERIDGRCLFACLTILKQLEHILFYKPEHGSTRYMPSYLHVRKFHHDSNIASLPKHVLSPYLLYHREILGS